MARTKIVATIGPASNNPTTVRKMLDAGMNVARLNFSHGDAQWHGETVAMLRRVAADENRTLAILGDLQGPKLRLGYVGPHGIPLSLNDEVMLTPHRGQPAMIHFPHPEIIEILEPNARLVFGDGEVEMRVKEKRGDAILATVTVPGLLESRKGVNVPGAYLPIATITDKDLQDLALACRLNLDYVALSFVRSAEDVHELRRKMQRYGAMLPIIAKIEKVEAVDRLEEIMEAADGLMVARGDLGIDVPPQEVPLLQKRIIQVCNLTGKPVITATQMLQSMIEHPRPTRAEASDVANAILDGTDAIMLSGETASGAFPVQSVLMMQQIADITESAYPYHLYRQRRHQYTTTTAQAIGAASCDIAEEVGAWAIVCATMSGSTARMIARHRPATPIIAVSPSPEAQRRLALVWGVECLPVPHFADTEAMIAVTLEALKPRGLTDKNTIVVTAGVPFGSSGTTNLIQVRTGKS